MVWDPPPHPPPPRGAELVNGALDPPPPDVGQNAGQYKCKAAAAPSRGPRTSEGPATSSSSFTTSFHPSCSFAAHGYLAAGFSQTGRAVSPSTYDEASCFMRGWSPWTCENSSPASVCDNDGGGAAKCRAGVSHV